METLDRAILFAQFVVILCSGLFAIGFIVIVLIEFREMLKYWRERFLKK